MSKTQTTAPANNETAVQKAAPTASERFQLAVAREFSGAISMPIELSPFQKKLAANLFVNIDAQLKALEAKRKGDGLSFTWENVNMPKMAIDAMHRINLGLDASIKNHLFAVPYFNDKTKKYDVDLRIGYEGKLYIRKQVAVKPPKDIILHLVFKNDRFVPLMQSADRKVESYEFDIINPFDRGDLIGGFGYIVYDDPSLNKLVILSKADFDKYAKKAMSREFWDGWYEQMCYKTLAHRVAEKVEIDPKKANNSFHVVEEQDNRDMFADRDPDLKGLKEVSIDIEMPLAQAEVTADFSAQSKPANDPAPGVKNPFED